MSRQHVVTFYSIEDVKDHKKIGRSVERFCVRNNLVGTFFSTPQGINTTLSGKKFFLLDLINLLEEKFKLKIKDQTWSESKSNPFKRLKIKCRDKLLPLEGNFDPVENRGKHVDHLEWNQLIRNPDTIIIDVRNDYETELGTFPNALIPNMKNLTEFPDYIENNLSGDKKKNVEVKPMFVKDDGSLSKIIHRERFYDDFKREICFQINYLSLVLVFHGEMLMAMVMTMFL